MTNRYNYGNIIEIVLSKQNIFLRGAVCRDMLPFCLFFVFRSENMVSKTIQSVLNAENEAAAIEENAQARAAELAQNAEIKAQNIIAEKKAEAEERAQSIKAENAAKVKEILAVGERQAALAVRSLKKDIEPKKEQAAKNALELFLK